MVGASPCHARRLCYPLLLWRIRAFVGSILGACGGRLDGSQLTMEHVCRMRGGDEARGRGASGALPTCTCSLEPAASCMACGVTPFICQRHSSERGARRVARGRARVGTPAHGRSTCSWTTWTWIYHYTPHTTQTQWSPGGHRLTSQWSVCAVRRTSAVAAEQGEKQDVARLKQPRFSF